MPRGKGAVSRFWSLISPKFRFSTQRCGPETSLSRALRGRGPLTFGLPSPSSPSSAFCSSRHQRQLHSVTVPTPTADDRAGLATAFRLPKFHYPSQIDNRPLCAKDQAPREAFTSSGFSRRPVKFQTPSSASHGNRYASDAKIVPRVRLGTVTKVGTMTSTVQISVAKQRYNKWFKRHTMYTERIHAHEPHGYLHVGDTVEFARFSQPTMAERYERGKLAGRDSGGVRHEVRRVVTPFDSTGSDGLSDGSVKGTASRAHRGDRTWPQAGELADRFGDVEFDRRLVDLRRPWNGGVAGGGLSLQDTATVKRRLALLEAMSEAVNLEIFRLGTQLRARRPFSPVSRDIGA